MIVSPRPPLGLKTQRGPPSLPSQGIPVWAWVSVSNLSMTSLHPYQLQAAGINEVMDTKHPVPSLPFNF